MSQSLERGFAVLELLDREPAGLGIRDIARRLSLHPANVQRIIASLKKLSYVQQLDSSKDYRLTFKAYFLGHSILRVDRLTAAAAPQLEKLTAEQKVSAYLGVRRENRAVYLQVMEGMGLVSTHVAPGESVYLHTTAMGKVLLCALADDEIAALYPDNVLPAMTEKSVASLPDLVAEVNTLRDREVVCIIEENLYGIAAVATPVRNHAGEIIAALSIAIPTSSRMEDEIRRLSTIVSETGRRISQDCGYGEE